MKNIPIRTLNEKVELGFEIRHHRKGIDDQGLESRHHLHGVEESGGEKFYAHRNDNYFFLVAERGYASMDVDFNPVKFREGDIYFVAPGQVQDNVRANESDYWYVEVGTSLIPKEYLELFENAAPFQQPQNMEPGEMEQCQSLLHLLAGQVKSNPDAVYYRQLTKELLQTFLCVVAGQYAKNDVGGRISRPRQISRDFKRLLKENIRWNKSPSGYAGMLNISEAYLNEAVKKTTGFTAGYWIRDYVILEAKRLLFYTEMSVKEIAHTLGYDDHTYFSRLFRQTVGITPLAFRAAYLK